MSGLPPRGFSSAAPDVADALRFFTRLRVGDPPPGAALDLRRIAWAAPVAGAVVGLIGALVLGLTTLLGLPPLLRAGLATAALVIVTGALHEDGLADAADGFGGGATTAAKLEIMRDSRVGAYGAIAIALALILRVGALAAALDGGFWRAALSLMLVGALSRAAALTPLALLPPARPDGAGAAAGRLDPNALAAAWISALVIALALGLVALGLAHAFAALLMSGAGALAMVALARRAIGGQTGDVAGAAQQLAEIAAWCGLLIGRGAPSILRSCAAPSCSEEPRRRASMDASAPKIERLPPEHRRNARLRLAPLGEARFEPLVQGEAQGGRMSAHADFDPLHQRLRHRSAVGSLHRVRPDRGGDRRLGDDERGGPPRIDGRTWRAPRRGPIAQGARRTGRIPRSALTGFILPVEVLAAIPPR